MTMLRGPARRYKRSGPWSRPTPPEAGKWTCRSCKAHFLNEDELHRLYRHKKFTERKVADAAGSVISTFDQFETNDRLSRSVLGRHLSE